MTIQDDTINLVAAEAEDEKAGYRIGGKGEAAWAMEKLRQLVEDQRTNEEVAAQRIQAVQEWRDEENAKLQADVDFFTGALKTYHQELFEVDPKRYKSISLPDGKLAHRVGSMTTVVEDQIALEVWVDEQAEADPSVKDLLHIKVTPNKAALKSRLDEGEIIPGVWRERGDETFNVEVGK